MYVVNVSNGAIEKKLTIGASTLRSIASAGEGKLIAVSWAEELWFWDGKGDPEKLLDGVYNVFTSLDDERVILETTDGEMIVWNWKTKEREVEFGGFNGWEVVDVAWDVSRRLAVFFMEDQRCWIAYEV